MCSTCGCGEADVRVTTLGMSHGDVALDGEAAPVHDHGHEHGHGHDHVHVEPDHELRTHTLELEVAILAKSDGLAARNRSWLAERGIRALNLMSSPGAGKTTLLERTIATIGRPVTVIAGGTVTEDLQPEQAGQPAPLPSSRRPGPSRGDRRISPVGGVLSAKCVG